MQFIWQISSEKLQDQKWIQNYLKLGMEPWARQCHYAIMLAWFLVEIFFNNILPSVYYHPHDALIVVTHLVVYTCVKAFDWGYSIELLKRTRLRKQSAIFLLWIGCLDMPYHENWKVLSSARSCILFNQVQCPWLSFVNKSRLIQLFTTHNLGANTLLDDFNYCSFNLQNVNKIRKVKCPVLVIHVSALYVSSYFSLFLPMILNL